MEIFYNQIRFGYEELKSYVSHYHLSIRELDAIYQYGGWLLDRMAGDLERILAYQFVENMNEECIERMERFLFISNSSGKTIEERRSIVAATLQSGGKLSSSKIRETIEALIGDDVNVDIEFTDQLLITVDAITADGVMHEAINDMLERMLTAHIAYTILYQVPLSGTIYFGSIIQTADIIEIRQMR